MIYSRQADGACPLGNKGSCSTGENLGAAPVKAGVIWGSRCVTLYPRETDAGKTSLVQPLRGRTLTGVSLRTALGYTLWCGINNKYVVSGMNFFPFIPLE